MRKLIFVVYTLRKCTNCCHLCWFFSLFFLTPRPLLSLFSLCKHARFDLDLQCKGDTHIDDHHTVEDCAIALGEAFDMAVGARKGIARWGYAMCPLDEALSRAVVDISSRPSADVNMHFKRDMIGQCSTEMLGKCVFPCSIESATIYVGCTLLK